MRTRHFMAATLILGSLAGTVAGAQTAAPRAPTWRVEEIDSLSCREAWRKGNRSADAFISMSRTLANHSLRERRMALPQDRRVGVELGEAIIKGCLNDPEEHLSSVIDREVRVMATPIR